jgi:membrane fusion protein (multidrug efflux system)
MEAHASHRRRRVIIWSSVGFVLVASAVVLSLAFKSAGSNAPAKKKSDKETAPAAPVELSTVTVGPISTYLQTSATLEPRNSAVLMARREGQVIELLAEEGQWVKAGEVLARFEDREASLAVDRATLSFEVVKREAERGDQLHAQGYLSPREQEDLDLKRRTASVELEQAKHNLDLTRITAPFSGRVTERQINMGETVTPGKACFQLVEFSPLLVRLFFPERDLSAIRVGQSARLTIDSQPGRTFEARVVRLNPVVDQSNGTCKVTLELPNPEGALRPGAFARVSLQTGSFPGALLLPRRGVVSEDGESFVFVARGDSAVRLPVKLGAVENETAQVLAGLRAGERVVTVGQGGLKQGSKIRVVRS